VTTETEFSLALDEARRGFDGLSVELPALRNQATQVLGVAGLAAAFLGGLALADGQSLETWGWVAVGGFVATACLAMIILWPRRFYAAPDPARLVAWAETTGVTQSQMVRDLALYMGIKYDANRAILDRLSRLYSCTVFTMLVEIAAFIIDLWSS
jgi:hypothetical protein